MKKITSEIVAKFCKENGYDNFEFHSDWNSKNVYIIEKEKDKGAYIGYPIMLIVDGSKPKIASPEDVFFILGLATNDDISKGEIL